MRRNAAEESTLASVYLPKVNLAQGILGLETDRNTQMMNRGISEDSHCCIECHHDVHLTDSALLPDPGCERLLIRNGNEDSVLGDW